MTEAISYNMQRALRYVDRLKNTQGLVSVKNLKACGVHGLTILALCQRGLIKTNVQLCIMDDINLYSVRLTRDGRRYV